MDLSKQLASPSDASAEVNAEAALRLRISGRSYRQIGNAIGLSHSRAYEIVIGRLQELRSLNHELVEELRTLELARLDDMWRRMYPKPQHPDEKIDPKTAMALLRIVQQRRAIAGLDVVQRNALPPADVPYLGPFDLDLLTLDQLREFEAIAMTATGLDPALEVRSPSPVSPVSMKRTSDEAPTVSVTGPLDSETVDFPTHDPDTGYPLAVALSTSRSTSYLPE